MNFKKLPFDQNINGWSAITDSTACYPALNRKITADWLVIGAGYAGLAFARRIAELRPQQHVVVLDAVDIADGASGRNSGFVIDLPHTVGSSSAELDHANSYRRLLQYGVSHLKDTVEGQNIQCDWRNDGKYHCSVSPDFDNEIEHYQQTLRTLGEDFQLLESQELRQRLGTDFYRRAVYTPNCILVNPAALIAGLAESLPENVSIYAQSPALEITTQGGIRAITPHGEVQANKLMFAINGAARGLPHFKGSVFAMSTFATLTEPLTSSQRARLGDITSWGLTPVNALAGATLRYTSDHRFLIREHVNFAPDLQTNAVETGRHARRHQQLFLRLYPQLEDVAMAYSWSGLISITRNGAPVWGELAPNIYSAAGCNGAGISKQSAFGRLLAEQALGEDNPLLSDLISLGRANYLPPRPFLDMGVKGFMARERWRSRHEI
ncbi:FAD-binding oxidoreductase [Klebsiella sp. BIGb0407]|uniref:NAD(P)/FAD-dependent oxidoreductase n=1 Tax=Klebsiella sp. BIGb0407 TaxID=2940603 RepID=UPI002169A621|nr:FAD-binding oxidoreductase [Klebsiella sp. BIGb0407]MCS3431112.1 glycine/D-amino acid oxidase-like deaminating enzyme [Klebsiella sp. BIGb0407]